MRAVIGLSLERQPASEQPRNGNRVAGLLIASMERTGIEPATPARHLDKHL